MKRMIIAIISILCLGLMMSPWAEAAGVPADAGQEAAGKTRFVLAMTWLPAFCKVKPDVPECSGLTADSPAATSLSLQGLWTVGKRFCGVEPVVQKIAEDGKWAELPEVTLVASLRTDLERVMPGTQSQLERLEWVKYGSCYDAAEAGYFADAIRFADQINGSALGRLMAGAVGKPVQIDAIKEALVASFGTGAGDRVRLRCMKDGDRTLLSGVTLALAASNQTEDDLQGRILGADATDHGCDGGLLLPVATP